jgi:hypothetical protein
MLPPMVVARSQAAGAVVATDPAEGGAASSPALGPSVGFPTRRCSCWRAGSGHYRSCVTQRSLPPLTVHGAPQRRGLG